MTTQTETVATFKAATLDYIRNGGDMKDAASKIVKFKANSAARKEAEAFLVDLATQYGRSSNEIKMVRAVFQSIDVKDGEQRWSFVFGWDKKTKETNACNIQRSTGKAKGSKAKQQRGARTKSAGDPTKNIHTLVAYALDTFGAKALCDEVQKQIKQAAQEAA